MNKSARSEEVVERHLRGLKDRFVRALDRVRGLPVELFCRSSLTVRITMTPPRGRCAVQSGEEEGLAARVARPGGGVSFAAASGSSLRSLDWVLETAMAAEPCSAPAEGTPGIQTDAAPRWAKGGGDDLLDLLPGGGPPSVPSLEEWLERSVQQIERSRGKGPRVAAAWIEAGQTVESLVASGGLAATRARTRAWSLARLRWRGTSETNHRVAAPGLEGLPSEGWLGTLGPENGRDGGFLTDAMEAAPVVLSPEPAAVLVRALVRALHGAGRKTGFAVGPAWQVVDDPLDPGALLGGDFDDAGFPTRRRMLADGRQGTDVIEGAGVLRRLSFRDPPAPLPTGLRVTAEPAALPDDALLVTALRLHPLGEIWMLDVDGVELHAGSPRGRVAGAVFRARPEKLVRACVAAAGVARRTHLGVETPSLVFQGLTGGR